MKFEHTSVLLEETVAGLHIKHNGIYVDGTLGGGGHSEKICQSLGPEGILIGIDVDQDALEAAKKRLEGYSCRKIFVQRNYSDIKEILKEEGIEGIDGAVLDLGVSSFQLDNPRRGFSYMKDAPLDMRMNQSGGFSAYDVVNTYSKKELTDVIKNYGEERWAARIGEFIVNARQEKPIETTDRLVGIIKAAIPKGARRDGPHPAKRTFQAIRIEVNDELGHLERAVDCFLDVLNRKGRLCIITFHSLEDRIVKDIIKKRINPCTCPKEFPVCVCGKVGDVEKKSGKLILPTEAEIEANSRARSAKLRVAEKL